MKRYLFRTGGKFNPIKNSDEFKSFILKYENCYMYVYNDDSISASLYYWGEAKRKNIVIKLVEK